MSKRTFNWVMGWALCALGAAGCSGAKSEEVADDGFLNGVPEQAALQMSLTDDATAEGLASDDAQVAAAYVSDELGSMSERLDAPATFGIDRPRQAVKDLNEALRDFLQPIAALVRAQAPSDVQGNVATWGPVTRGATEYRLYVREGLLQRFGWLLQARPDGSTSDFGNVAAGAIRVGTVARRGHGVVGVDLDALSSADPSVTAGGKILAAFAHEPGATVLAYALRGFTPHSADQTALDALFQGLHLASGYNRVRLAFRTNLPESATAAEELVLGRVREHVGEGGRADLLATGGDIADGRVWVVSECWDHALASTYRRVLDCPGDGIAGDRCTEKSETGDVAACLSDLAAAEYPPSDANASMSDAQSPDPDLAPPSVMPSGDPSASD
jgi:hypothetical protein